MSEAVQRILVVDDHEDITRAVTALLAALGYDVRVASCGRDALIAIKEYDPDLVVLDIDLGDMTGFDVCRALRSLSSGRRPYVVAHTGIDEHRLQTSWVDAGFDGYLRKPIDGQKIVELIATANRHLQSGA